MERDERQQHKNNLDVHAVLHKQQMKQLSHPILVTGMRTATIPDPILETILLRAE
jgi:hypothetical protein